jgi:hypothetical protein
LSKAERDQRVIWLLDGYDELSPTQQATANREIALLDRFILTTRTSQPVLNRRIDAEVQLLPIDRDNALAFIEVAYPTARSSMSDWMHDNTDVQRALSSGLILRQAAEVAQDSPQWLQLTAALDRAITQQMMTHVRLRSTVDSDVVSRARIALGHLAWQVLSPQRELDRDRNQVSDHELRATWNAQNNASEDSFYDILRATGLLSKEANGWNFWSDLIRDELAAEYAVTENLIHTELAYYPQYVRIIAFWAAKLIHGKQPGIVIEFLQRLMADREADPYGARWLGMVAVLTECFAIKHHELDLIRHQTEQALIALWNETASNRMKAWITDSLRAIRASSNLPAPVPESWEEVWNGEGGVTPYIDLSLVLVAAGHSDLATAATRSSVHENDIAQALIEALQWDDATIACAATQHLYHRDLANATIIEMEQGRRPIQRLVNIALAPSTDQSTASNIRQQAKLPQSLALAVLSQPDILCNPGVLRWIPEGIIHMLMAGLNLRIRFKDNKPMLITADGQERVLASNIRVPWW